MEKIFSSLKDKLGWKFLMDEKSFKTGFFVGPSDTNLPQNIKSCKVHRLSSLFLNSTELPLVNESDGDERPICLISPGTLPFRRESLDTIFIWDIWHKINRAEGGWQEKVEELLTQIHYTLKERGQLIIGKAPNYIQSWKFSQFGATLKGYRSLLMKTGFVDLRFFWLYPSAEAFSWVIPLEVGDGSKHTLTGMTEIIFGGHHFFKRFLIKLAARLSLLPLLIPRYTIMARKSGHAGNQIL